MRLGRPRGLVRVESGLVRVVRASGEEAEREERSRWSEGGKE